jgi:hypothetical protein
VCSYGNRLFCDWEENNARFRWGNSTTYSKYFTDYQRFLERPGKTAQKFQKEITQYEAFYEIQLDLSAFYDSIDRSSLLERLRLIVDESYDTGKIIAQRCVDISDIESPEELAERVLKIEHQLLPDVIEKFALGKVFVDKTRVRVLN